MIAAGTRSTPTCSRQPPRRRVTAGCARPRSPATMTALMSSGVAIEVLSREPAMGERVGRDLERGGKLAIAIA